MAGSLQMCRSGRLPHLAGCLHPMLLPVGKCLSSNPRDCKTTFFWGGAPHKQLLKRVRFADVELRFSNNVRFA